jgi:hypothetical protein
MSERKCKGSMFTDLIKLIKAVPGADWNRYLKAEDWEIINGLCLPTTWYPIESYMRMGYAAFQLISGGDVARVRVFGLAAMKELWEGPYKPFLDRHDPFEAVQKFLDLRRAVFNFSKMEMERKSGSSLRVRISELGNFDNGIELFLTLTGVHFLELVRLNGGESPTLETSREGRAHDPVLIFDLKWQTAAQA